MKCPKDVNGVKYSIFPKNPEKRAYSHRLPGNVWTQDIVVYEVEVTEIFGTVFEDIIQLRCNDENEMLIIKYPNDGILVRRQNFGLLYLCVRENINISAGMLRTLGDHMFIQTILIPNYNYVNTGYYILDPLNFGVGLTRISLSSECIITHGCGNIPTKLFLNHDRYNPMTNVRSCEIDIMKNPNIGFYCEGILDPPDCCHSLYDETNNLITLMNTSWDLIEHHGTLMRIHFSRYMHSKQFRGSCYCREVRTKIILSQITLKRNTEHVCNIANMVMKNRIRPLTDYWCNVILHSGDSLNIIFPTENGHYDEDASSFVLDRNVEHHCISALVPRNASTHCIVEINYWNDPLYRTTSLYRIFGNDVLTIDDSNRKNGHIVITYNNKPSRKQLQSIIVLKYIWIYLCNDQFKSENVFSNVVVTIVPRDYSY
ncbi:bifunctional 6-Cysteine (6-Cys) domain/6-Cysteine (6-Cys) domain superfamily [Babesia duncani]|uniref:Bifunctional 6-Cysteine (6-Cys) domain/6-Cysteine (6-Cys) domain superfamily n=1 Tax=Babesia duncani TaxID=323732 RepID=A0AAD9PMJ4_9APIC|nr:bifunctional 6-Cysteine (6-Cys) domain/6-Cysteine (6-Cys) domain superfamily [Babesia duncani]KAK2197553.1 bifunctional 6-Cysteine (6-Cys) domain/6-Cysteine (6-Cys) domain superfamily [Babesia duncani]